MKKIYIEITVQRYFIIKVDIIQMFINILGNKKSKKYAFNFSHNGTPQIGIKILT